jgi:hypothetical protein
MATSVSPNAAAPDELEMAAAPNGLLMVAVLDGLPVSNSILLELVIFWTCSYDLYFVH